jgi:site-specific DNA-cytosine methylase
MTCNNLQPDNLQPALQPNEPQRVLELFAGIGGFATACPTANVVAAIDINRSAERAYRLNHPHPFHVREIESMSDNEFRDFSADFWWMSPPCQPYSRRGGQLDTDDPRARPLLRLLDAIAACTPRWIGLENVFGFEQSRSYSRLNQVLEQAGYHVSTLELCPSQLGWPNRRPRFYLLASLTPLPAWQPLPNYATTLGQLLPDADCEPTEPSLLVDESTVDRYGTALDRVRLDQRQAITACFAGSYGKTLLRSGSYLELPESLPGSLQKTETKNYRRFTPQEVACLMGFPGDLRLDGLDNRTAWKLLGNSLSIPAVRYLLSHVFSGCASVA